jgi:hypothetical protein
LLCTLQAVKCQADSNVKNAAANPRPMYTMFSNIFASIVLKGYKVVGVNTEQMTIIFTHLFRFDKYNFQ